MRPSPRGSDPKEYPEGHDIVVSKGPCPKCPTSEGNVTYADGHAHCFACKHTTPGGRDASAPWGDDDGGEKDGGGGSTRAPSNLLVPGNQTAPFAALRKRNITEATLKRFGYFAAGFNGKPVQVAPYYDQHSDTVVLQKLRFPNKDFTVLKRDDSSPTITECRLFGHHVFGDKFDRQVVVTEGEIDAMSVAQELDFKVACVSIGAGATAAAKSIKANYLWLDRFKEIILWFDDDEPGREAAEECAKLFAIGKVRIAKVDGCKDASDVLQRGTPGDIKTAIYAAIAWRPPGIVNAAASPKDVCSPSAEDLASSWRFDWPWAAFTEWFGPIQPGQVCLHVAGTGIGKTSFLAEVEHSLVKQGCKVAHLGFEDTRRDVKLRLMGIEFNERLDIEPRADAEMIAMHEKTFGSGLYELFDPETAEWSFDAVIGYLRYCAKALDCLVLVVDPLTFLAGLLRQGDNVQQALSNAATEMAIVAKELGVAIHIAHHLTDPRGGSVALTEGLQTSINQVRGSGDVSNFAVQIVGYERNQQASGDLALITLARALKNRTRGRTGPIMNLRYNPGTGRLLPTKDIFPGPGKVGGGASSGKRNTHQVPEFDSAGDF